MIHRVHAVVWNVKISHPCESRDEPGSISDHRQPAATDAFLLWAEAVPILRVAATTLRQNSLFFWGFCSLSATCTTLRA